MRGRRTVPLIAQLRRGLGQSWYRSRSRLVRRGSLRILTEAVRQMPVQAGLPPPASWSAQRVLPTDTDVTVAIFGTKQENALAIGRIADLGVRDPGLSRNSQNLAQLQADPRLHAFHPLLPTPLAAGSHRGRAYAVEGALRGVSAGVEFGQEDAADRLLELGTAAMAPLYEASATPAVIGDEMIERWIGPQLDVLRRAGGLLDDDRAAASIRRLEAELRKALHARPCCMTWTHGDYWAGNLLVDDDQQVVGIVDWDAACPQGLPILDAVHLLLTTRVTVEGADLGALVAQFLDGRPHTPQERAVLASLDWALAPEPVDARAISLLVWLGHVTAVLDKRPTHAANRRWMARNIDTVLAKL